MARIVAGFATSFSPQLHVPADMWPAIGERDKTARAFLGADGKSHSYDEMVAMAGPGVKEGLAPTEQASRHAKCQQDIADLGARIRGTELDALIVLTDDEHRLFGDDAFPSIFLFAGETVPYVPNPITENTPAPTKAAAWAYGQEPKGLTGAPKLAGHILRQLPAAGFDVTRSQGLKEGVGIGHHVGFVNTRLLEGKSVPMMPILFNASFPPNVMTVARFYGFGQALARAVESWPDGQRVGLLAVGGFSHPVIDEETDRRIVEGCQKRDSSSLCTISEARLTGGSGQGRVWLTAAGALESLSMHLIDYIPAYRSPAGTGCGMGFAYWD